MILAAILNYIWHVVQKLLVPTSVLASKMIYHERRNWLVCVWWWWCNTFLTWHETKKRRKKTETTIISSSLFVKIKTTTTTKNARQTCFIHSLYGHKTSWNIIGAHCTRSGMTREKKEQEHNFCFVCQIISNVYYGQNNWNLKLKLNETKYLDKI